ncbi:MAG: hypothetical protein K2W99_05785 [Chthoniobacterales bacterium]|nr:hypothetical protein [Chthoniobacterales bacterium]
MIRIRPLLFSFFCFIAITLPLRAREMASGAIQALREAGRPELLLGLAEVKGEHGDPNPEEWILLCNDSSAPSGIRELIIKDHHIISESTPTVAFSGTGALPQLDLSKPLMESGALFAAANRSAIDHHIGFDYVNYSLRIDAVTGKPLWIAKLYKISKKGDKHKDGKKEDKLVGTLQFSAETGAEAKGL